MDGVGEDGWPRGRHALEETWDSCVGHRDLEKGMRRAWRTPCELWGPPNGVW